jgi:hypothetical protein
MNASPHGGFVEDDDLTAFLVGLPAPERRRLLTLVATRMDPKGLIEPLTDGVAEALEEGQHQGLSRTEVKDAVRRALVENMKTRQTHLSQLAQLVQLVEDKGRHDALARKIQEFCGTIGVKRVTGAEDLSLFRVVEGNPETEPHVAVLKPAYVEELSGRLVLAGEVAFTEVPRVRAKEDARAKGRCESCGNTLAGRKASRKGHRR